MRKDSSSVIKNQRSVINSSDSEQGQQQLQQVGGLPVWVGSADGWVGLM